MYRGGGRIAPPPLTERVKNLFDNVMNLGNVETFIKHLMRIFDTDGNGFLNFKEFLIAMDISKCHSGVVSQNIYII